MYRGGDVSRMEISLHGKGVRKREQGCRFSQEWSIKFVAGVQSTKAVHTLLGNTRIRNRKLGNVEPVLSIQGNSAT